MSITGRQQATLIDEFIRKTPVPGAHAEKVRVCYPSTITAADTDARNLQSHIQFQKIEHAGANLKRMATNGLH
jgi:hypothetical protein